MQTTLLASFFGIIKMLCLLFNIQNEICAGTLLISFLVVVWNAQDYVFHPNPTELGHLSVHIHSLSAKPTNLALWDTLRELSVRQDVHVDEVSRAWRVPKGHLKDVHVTCTKWPMYVFMMESLKWLIRFIFFWCILILSNSVFSLSLLLICGNHEYSEWGEKLFFFPVFHIRVLIYTLLILRSILTLICVYSNGVLELLH